MWRPCGFLSLDCSPAELISHAVRHVGAEKVLYGSEGVWPQTVLALDLSAGEKAKILGENALWLLGMERPTV